MLPRERESSIYSGCMLDGGIYIAWKGKKE
jgi:hypothetical protein